MLSNREKKRPWGLRILTYAVMFLLSWLLVLVMNPDFVHFKSLEAWSMMLGYSAFIFLALTLLIGPLKRWLPEKAGTILWQARRDVGIWAGLTAILHVITVFMIYNEGKEYILIGDMSPGNSSNTAEGWLSLFFVRGLEDGKLHLQYGLIGIANYLGAVALVFLLAMWLTSSNRAERFLGGSAWKRIHSSILLVFILVIFHGLIYIHGIKGFPWVYADWMLWIAGLVLLLRIIAFAAAVIARDRRSN